MIPDEAIKTAEKRLFSRCRLGSDGGSESRSDRGGEYSNWSLPGLNWLLRRLRSLASLLVALAK